MKRWYVVQVYAGYEDAVKQDIERSIEKSDLGEHFGQILVPSAKAKPLADGEEEKGEQLFPGYILVEMEDSVQAKRLVKASPRAIRFLGGKDPIAMPQNEVDRVIKQIRGEVKVVKEKSEFTVGSEVDITEGPFAGFVGIIEKIDDESEKLTVMVSIFGRMTPVEIGFGQVKR